MSVQSKIKNFLFVLIAVSVTGCTVTQQGNQLSEQENNNKQTDGCKYVQRNLTVKWSKKAYWCLPKQ